MAEPPPTPTMDPLKLRADIERTNEDDAFLLVKLIALFESASSREFVQAVSGGLTSPTQVQRMLPILSDTEWRAFHDMLMRARYRHEIAHLCLPHIPST